MKFRFAFGLLDRAALCIIAFFFSFSSRFIGNYIVYFTYKAEALGRNYFYKSVDLA